MIVQDHHYSLCDIKRTINFHIISSKQKSCIVINKKIANDDIRFALESVGLDPEDKRKVKAYSLGMKQKLLIAQAIFEQQKILLLDEPTNALDEESILKFRNILLRLKEKGCLIIIASHNKEDISILCDKVLKMDNGKLCQNEQ